MQSNKNIFVILNSWVFNKLENTYIFSWSKVRRGENTPSAASSKSSKDKRIKQANEAKKPKLATNFANLFLSHSARGIIKSNHILNRLYYEYYSNRHCFKVNQTLLRTWHKLNQWQRKWLRLQLLRPRLSRRSLRLLNNGWSSMKISIS